MVSISMRGSEAHLHPLQDQAAAVPARESLPDGVLGVRLRAALGVPHAGAGAAAGDQPQHAGGAVCRRGPSAALRLQAPPQP